MSATTDNRIAVPLPAVDSPLGNKLPIKSSTRKNEYSWVDQFPVLGSLSGIFQQSIYVDFELREPSVAFTKATYLEIQVANANVAAATLIQAQYLVDRTELYIGSRLIGTYYAENEFNDNYSMYDTEQTTLQASMQNWNPATYDTAGNTIAAAGGTALYTIRICTLLDQLDLPLSEIRPEYFRFRCYFRNGTAIFDSGSAHTTSTDITCTAANLYVMGKRLSQSAKMTLQASLKTPHRYHGFVPERQIISLGAVATSTNLSQTLTSFDGTYSRLITFLRAQNATQEQLYQLNNTALYVLTNVTLLMGDGSPYLQQNMSRNIMRLAYQFEEGYNSLFTNVLPVYFWNFSTDAPKAQADGSLLGSQSMNGNWRFQAVTAATAGNNCELVVLGSRYMTCKVDNGRFTFELH